VATLDGGNGEVVMAGPNGQDEIRAFIWGMHAIARDLAPRWRAKLDLKAVRHLLDLGGGPATYAISFAQANPKLKATVFDLPMPIDIARENIAKNGLTDRVGTLAGNFLKDEIGTGYDFIWISQILHSHDEEQCQFIIAKAVAALTPGGTWPSRTSTLTPTAPAPRARPCSGFTCWLSPPGAGPTPRGKWRSGCRRRAWRSRSSFNPGWMRVCWCKEAVGGSNLPGDQSQCLRGE